MRQNFTISLLIIFTIIFLFQNINSKSFSRADLKLSNKLKLKDEELNTEKD